MSRIFVPYGVSDPEVRAIFGIFGRIDDICINQPAKKNAYAFVAFHERVSAGSLIGQHLSLSGHKLRVELAREPDFAADRAAGLSDATASLDMCLSDVPRRLPKLFQNDRDIYPRVSLLLRDDCLLDFHCPFRHIESRNGRGLYCRGLYNRNGSRITHGLPGQANHNAGNFPHNIRNWIWWEYDSENPMWRLLCQLENGLYAFFVARAGTYSEWSDSGRDTVDLDRMELYVAPRPAALIGLAMREEDYAAYLAQTAPTRHWDSDTSPQARRLAVAMIAHRRLGRAAGRWAAELVRNKDVMLLVLAAAEPEARSGRSEPESDEACQ